MLPVFAIIGRPNVGKSTLFNCLTKTRDALVADEPGVTRDRQYGVGEYLGHRFIVVDTGGLEETTQDPLAPLVKEQVAQALAEASVVLLVVDARAGLTPDDHAIAQMLRSKGLPVWLLINKIDQVDAPVACADFYELGFKNTYPVAAARKQGIEKLLYALFATLPPAPEEIMQAEEAAAISVALVGRPNVGKSTLINRLLGEARVVVFDQPGTTRDSIKIPFERRGKKYILVDTAGVRKPSKTEEGVEKFSVIKTLETLEYAHVILFVIDAKEGLTEQDMRLLDLIVQSGRALILVFNKWDKQDEIQKNQFKEAVLRKLTFVDFARRYFISALHGSGVGQLFRAIDEAYASANRPITTGLLTRLLAKALKTHQPPLVNGKSIRLNYAHLGGHHPMVLVLHGKRLPAIPGSYLRFLTHFFRKELKLVGVPLLIKLRSDANPYVAEAVDQ